MKKIKYILLSSLIFICFYTQAQVKTNFNSEALISNRGRFAKDYKTQIDFELPSKNINTLLEIEKKELKTLTETKLFRVAVPVTLDLNISKLLEWTVDKEFAYSKYTIKLNGALSSSINFDQFYLVKGTEMYVYNENGNMITGPITENENNPNKIWGSWVYQGQFLTIEIKTPIATKEQILLHSNNIAYGYKEVYNSKVAGFGQSGPCNINVFCPLGNGWEPERNSVALGISGDGTGTFSGSMVMNTCNTNRPFFLTANHVYDLATPVQNVTGWRFAFQAWSTTCPNPGVNTDGVMYNGSTLRARNAASDFCLVELNTIPPSNSGLHYAGWNRSATPAQNATGIHHPSGDLMKISRANNAVTVASAFGTTNQHWRSDWSPQNNGAGQTVTPITEGGSSGSPLFDQNHRIVGQLHGGPSACGAAQLWDFYGRFDLSWTGGGTNATRLSNWLDATNTGAVTTNTTNISNLVAATAGLSIRGTNNICNGSAIINALNVPAGSTVAWVSSNPNIATVVPIPGTDDATVTQVNIGYVTITASLVGCINGTAFLQVAVGSHSPYSYAVGGEAAVYSQAVYSYALSYPWYTGVPNNINWRLPADWTLMWGQGTSQIYVTTGAYGSGAVEVDFDNNCGVSTGVFKTVTVGSGGGVPQRNAAISASYELFPNPTNGQFTITLKSADKAIAIKEVRVKNKSGAVVFNQKFVDNQKQQTIKLNNQPIDIYVVEIFDGIQWQAKKLSLQR